jgi:hypothetical protein
LPWLAEFRWIGLVIDAPAPSNAYHASHVARLLTSYQHWTGQELLELPPDMTVAEALYRAEFVVISHGTQADPVFNYGNLAAQRLFEMSWAELTALPSRCSAEPVNRDDRARLMERVTTQGFIDDYRGVRISSTGRRFLIEQAFVWNVLDEAGALIGQAATFSDWTTA